MRRIFGAAGFGDRQNKLLDDLIGTDSLGVGCEIGEETVPQDGLGDPLDILAPDV